MKIHNTSYKSCIAMLTRARKYHSQHKLHQAWLVFSRTQCACFDCRRVRFNGIEINLDSVLLSWTKPVPKSPKYLCMGATFAERSDHPFAAQEFCETPPEVHEDFMLLQ